MPTGPCLGHSAQEGTSGKASIQWIPAPELKTWRNAAVAVIKTRETLGQELQRAAAGSAEPRAKYGI